jgi:hypothetical protein
LLHTTYNVKSGLCRPYCSVSPFSGLCNYYLRNIFE